ncbi:MAG TPA: glycoside hydrolase family 3 N-terminal domain-containing protein, partial [Ktedonobacterales bacterium]|nr:glycoside hydrolase family 3 N-terminal domain-containing protein [Ktedonobacterales bacterium]
MSSYQLIPPKTQPTAEKKMARWRWALMALALSFVVLPGMRAMGSLFGEAQASQAISPTVVLPTVPPVQMHQITPAEYANAIIKTLSLDDEIAQMIMVKLVGTNYSSTEAVMVQQEHVGAVLAFGDAIANPTQVRQLTANLAGHAYLPLWIATDQEGGYVNRFQPLVGYRPGEQVIGATGNLASATAAGRQTAQDFADFGFNFALAPVVDINQPGVTTSQLYGRMYSTDPDAIAPMANAYLEGLQQSGTIVGTAKHFPGLGAASTDPHRGLPIIYKTQAQLDAHEFVPYRQLLAMGNVQAIMVTHEYLPEIDPAYPATLSPKITTGLLRGDLGFQGVIVTDSLDMEALAEQYPI